MPKELNVLEGQSILLTGSSGMLGCAVTAAWKDKNRITGISKSGRLGSVACDLTDEAAIEKALHGKTFTLAVHTAAYSDVDGCERDPGQAYKQNVIATKNLAAFCRRTNTPLLHISTDYVFDGEKKTPYTESDAVCPVQVYGMTKLAAEHYAAGAGLASTIVRTSWLYGAGNPKNFVNAIAEKLKNEKSVGVLDDQVNAPACVDDLARWLVPVAGQLMEAAKSGTAKKYLYHVCDSGETTRLAMAVKIKDILGLKDREVKRVDFKDIPHRAAIRPKHSTMSNALFQKTFGIQIKNWQQSLERYLAHGSGVCASL